MFLFAEPHCSTGGNDAPRLFISGLNTIVRCDIAKRLFDRLNALAPLALDMARRYTVNLCAKADKKYNDVRFGYAGIFDRTMWRR